jgi:hypothetical protein
VAINKRHVRRAAPSSRIYGKLPCVPRLHIHVAYWHKADIPTAPAFVRFWTKADIAAQLRVYEFAPYYRSVQHDVVKYHFLIAYLA